MGKYRICTLCGEIEQFSGCEHDFGPWVNMRERRKEERHGYPIESILIPEEQDFLDKQREAYLAAYPRLKEPASMDMLNQALLLQIRIRRLELYIDGDIIQGEKAEEKKATIMALHDRCVHSWALLLTKLGLTFTAQQYIPRKRKAPIPPADLLKAMEKELGPTNTTNTQ